VGLGSCRSTQAFAGSALGDRAPEAGAEEMLHRFPPGRPRDRPAGVLPEGGAQAARTSPWRSRSARLLLLDEPTSGVSADEKFALMDLVLAPSAPRR